MQQAYAPLNSKGVHGTKRSPTPTTHTRPSCLQTYVEALEPEFELGGVADLEAQAAAKADAVLIDVSAVHYLNEVIQSHGAGKVETLVAIKDFKKGIYDLQWEKERLAMEGEDASHKIKEIQMARAPVGLLRDVLVEEEESKNGDAVGAARETGAPSLPRQRRARRGRESKEIDYPCVFDHGHRCACICASYFKPNWGEVAPNPTRE